MYRVGFYLNGKNISCALIPKARVTLRAVWVVWRFSRPTLIAAEISPLLPAISDVLSSSSERERETDREQKRKYRNYNKKIDMGNKKEKREEMFFRECKKGYVWDAQTNKKRV